MVRPIHFFPESHVKKKKINYSNCLSGTRVCSASDYETVRTWDARTEEQIRQPLKGHNRAVKLRLRKCRQPYGLQKVGPLEVSLSKLQVYSRHLDNLQNKLAKFHLSEEERGETEMALGQLLFMTIIVFCDTEHSSKHFDRLVGTRRDHPLKSHSLSVLGVVLKAFKKRC